MSFLLATVRCASRLGAGPGALRPVASRGAHDWMAAADLEAKQRAGRPRQDGTGLGAVHEHVLNSVQHEIKEEAMSTTIRLEERLARSIAALGPLRADAQRDEALVPQFNRDRSTALRQRHELNVQRESATGLAPTDAMDALFAVPAPL